MKSTTRPTPKSKPRPAIPLEKDPANDLKTFAALPEATKALAKLQDDVDKTDGAEAVNLQKKIQTTGERKEGRPRPGG